METWVRTWAQEKVQAAEQTGTQGMCQEMCMLIVCKTNQEADQDRGMQWCRCTVTGWIRTGDGDSQDGPDTRVIESTCPQGAARQ